MEEQMYNELVARELARRTVTEALNRSVAKARKEGLTWEVIGWALGLSRQEAWRQYHAKPEVAKVS